MSDTRADKLARMAAAVESPHEAAIAATKLEMQAWRQARQACDPAALMRLCELPDRSWYVPTALQLPREPHETARMVTAGLLAAFLGGFRVVGLFQTPATSFSSSPWVLPAALL